MVIKDLFKTHRQKLRFGAVGMLNTAVDFGLYSALTYFLALPLIAANFISTSAGFTVSFFLNRTFTFQSQNSRKFHEFVRFLGVTLVSLWIIQPLTIYAASFGLGLIHLSGILLLALPKLLAIALGLVWNYWCYSRFVFAEQQPGTLPLPLHLLARLRRVQKLD